MLSAAVLNAAPDARSASTAAAREVMCARESIQLIKTEIHSWIQANTTPKSRLVGSPRYLFDVDRGRSGQSVQGLIITFWLAGPSYLPTEFLYDTGGVACIRLGRRTAALSSYV